MRKITSGLDQEDRSAHNLPLARLEVDRLEGAGTVLADLENLPAVEADQDLRIVCQWCGSAEGLE